MENLYTGWLNNIKYLIFIYKLKLTAKVLTVLNKHQN